MPIHRNWYKATISHNTVLVDGKSQAPAAARLLQFDSTPVRTVAIAQCSDGYPGVLHTRLLMQTADYLLVFDDLQADGPHRFDWFYHNRGTLAECSVPGEPVETTGSEFPGMEYVENTRTGTTDAAARVAFSTGDVTNTLTFDAAPATELLTGDGVGASVVDRIPLVRVTRRGPSARFAAVLEPTSTDTSPTVRSVSWKETAGGLRIEVIRDGASETIAVDRDWNVTPLQE